MSGHLFAVKVEGSVAVRIPSFGGGMNSRSDKGNVVVAIRTGRSLGTGEYLTGTAAVRFQEF